jgi:hypothetical protein
MDLLEQAPHAGCVTRTARTWHGDTDLGSVPDNLRYASPPNTSRHPHAPDEKRHHALEGMHRIGW